MSPLSFPPTVPFEGVSFPTMGPLEQVPHLLGLLLLATYLRYYETLRLLTGPLGFSSVLVREQGDGSRKFRSSPNDACWPMRSLRFPRNPFGSVPRSLTPVEECDHWPSSHPDAFRSFDNVGLHYCLISWLYHAAHFLAVYASRLRSPLTRKTRY